jgi:hypothetical protein
MTPANWEQLVEPLELIGRDARGVLYVGAPASTSPANSTQRIRPLLARALFDDGESELVAKHVQIVEAWTTTGG